MTENPETIDDADSIDLQRADADSPTREQLEAEGLRAAKFHQASMLMFAVAAIGLLATVQVEASMVVRTVVAIVLVISGIGFMGTTMWVYTAKTERKRRGFGKPAAQTSDGRQIKESNNADAVKKP